MDASTTVRSILLVASLASGPVLAADVAAITAPPEPAVAVSSASDADLRRAADEQFRHGNYVGAAPLYERLVERHPDEAALQESLGFALLAAAVAIEDPTARRARRMRARTVLLRARELGDASNLLQVTLESLPEDGSESAFSSNAGVDGLMRDAEAAFTRGDLDGARKGYLQALLAEPNLYEAPLFLGDVAYKQNRQEEAGEWYARAVAIDPDRETAYRYWGDALMAAGRVGEARDRFIDAVLAEPYTRRARVGLSQWADRVHVKLQVPVIEPKVDVKREPGKKASIVVGQALLNAPQDEQPAWFVYGATRALWMDGKFAATYPDEGTYRHSLAEETEALRSLLAFAGKSEGAAPGSPAFADLRRLADAGLLESYVLLFLADEGIARDYAAYRAAHRDLLRRLLDEVVVPRAPAQRP